MASGDISEKFKSIKLNEQQDINILLLGESGVGKSTFINSIANYLHFKSFKKASKSELLVLIPSMITVTNSNMEQVTLTVGSDNNEYQEIGAAATQDVKTYVFPIGEGKTRLRLIDSPGLGDPRGIEQDDINCENILAYLGQLEKLHAICFLMKPTTTRITVLFEYCVKQILSRLEKSASKNIIFVFTNTRGTNYSPGDTLPCLKAVIEDIKSKPPYVNIPLKDNIFSVDNEAFRILVAMSKGITYDENIQEDFIKSWKNSSKECWRLISYIVGDASRDGLTPHQLYNTISINEARRIIVQLSQPLADISQLIHDNIRILERHQKHLRMDNQSLDELKKKLHIPIIKLEVTQLTQPVTVCTSPKCAEMVQVGEAQKWHYRQRCHDPCYLTTVTKEIVGDLNLMHCAAMSGRVCMKCTCDFSVHMHVYYLTKTVSDKIEDNVVKNNINKKEEALRESQRLITQIDQRKSELEQERNVIIRSTAQFAHFLQHNAISPFNDSYKAYIEYLISRENSLGRNGDREVIHNLEQLLYQYQEIKAAFENSLNLDKKYGLDVANSSTVTPQIVMNTIHQLYQLKHNGGKIKELFKKQKASRTSEYDKNCEYIHPKSSDISQTDGTKDKPKKNKKQPSKSTDDEGKKKENKKKDSKSTDDERKQKKGSSNQNNKPNQKPKPYKTYQPNQTFGSRTQWQEPPPPYDGFRNQRHHQQVPVQLTKEGEPNVVVKVQLTQPGKSSEKSQHRPPQDSYYGGPHESGSYYGAPQHNYQGPYSQGAYQGQYQGPPQGHYHGAPPLHGQYGPSPPHGQYLPPPPPGQYGPPPFQGQAQGPYYAPPSGPPQGQYYRQYSGQSNDQGYQRRNQGNRGRGAYFKKGNDGQRTKSKSRPSKGGKSGNEKSSRSSDSDSSTE